MLYQSTFSSGWGILIHVLNILEFRSGLLPYLLYDTVVTATTHKDMTSPCLVGEFEAGLIKTSEYLRTDCITLQVLRNKMVTVDGGTRSES